MISLGVIACTFAAVNDCICRIVRDLVEEPLKLTGTIVDMREVNKLVVRLPLLLLCLVKQ